MPPLELIVGLLVHLILPAMGTSGLVGAAAAWLGPRRLRDAAIAAAFGLGLVAGDGWDRPLPFLPELPRDFGWPCLLVAPLAAVALSVITALVRRPPWHWAILIVGLPVVAIGVVPDSQHTPAWLSGLLVLLVANLVVLERTARRFRRWYVPLAWAVVLAGGAAILLLHAHSALLTNAAILLAAALGGLGFVSLFKSISLRWVAPPMALALVGLMVCGHHDTFSEVPAATFILIAAAPLPLGFLLHPGARGLPKLARAALYILLPLIPVAIAIALAIAAEGLAVVP
jgi:hypothetical protein